MNICICISGQVRGSMEPFRKLANDVKCLPNNVNVTFIFSIWKNKGVKIDGAIGFPQLSRIFEPELSKIIPISYYGPNFWEHLPKTYNFLLKQSEFEVKKEIKILFPDAILDVEDEILDLEFPDIKTDKNSIKMLYKRWRCNEIKKKLERKKEKFDLVLVARPDVKLKFNIKNTAELDDEHIFVPHSKNRQKYIDDSIAYGTSNVIDSYCSLFSKSISASFWRGIHFELFDHLQSLNLKLMRPNLIQTRGGLEQNTLIKTSMVLEDNEFLSSIYCSSYDIKTLSKIELISLYTKLHLDSKNIDNAKALNFLILADISNREIISFSKDRDKYIFNQLIYLLDALEVSSIDEILALKLDGAINNQAIDNLQRLFSKLNKSKLNKFNIMFMLKTLIKSLMVKN